MYGVVLLRFGIACSLASSALFAGLYFYATLLVPLDGKEIFAWRMLLTLPFLTMLMVVGNESRYITALFARIKKEPWLLVGLCASSALLGSQQWLFLWAPINQRGMDLSLGYFMLPLTLLLVGQIFYRERLSLLQTIATVSAALGVLHQLYFVGHFSWLSLFVAAGFPLYFAARKKLRTDNLGGLWFDMLLTFPVAAYFIFKDADMGAAFQRAPGLYVLVPLLGMLTAAAFMTYILASRKLPFSLFGLLGYVEPVLIVFVALAIGERIKPDEMMTYIPIWTAVGLLVVDGALHVRRQFFGSPA
ncbi:EamA family transporter RarD [Paraburkholderia rhynchosiae]|nr:EamA family transporter RarD [Paraburkholderia rhynchosiae]